MSPAPLVLKRVYDAPAERVFRAWTDAAELARWYTPFDGGTLEILYLKLEVGGGYRVKFGDGAGETCIETGEYLELVPPTRLVLRTELRRGDELLAQTHCAISLVDIGGKTELTLTETGFPADMREPRTGGWGRTLDHLFNALD